MTIAKFLEDFETMSDDDRDRYGKILLVKMTPISRNELVSFCANWNSERSFTDFLKTFKLKLVDCLGIEMSEVGSKIRKQIGMVPITMEIEL